MSKRRTQQQARRAARNEHRSRAQANPSGNSAYGRKRTYLNKNGGWGFEYADKPWRSGTGA